MPKAIDLTGKKFGKLTVIEKDKPYYTSGGHKQVKWLCKCECGNVVSVTSANLRNGNTTSCGCNRCPDLTGKRFGKLTVVSRSKRKGTQHFWTCLCDCGNIVDVRSHQLMKGVTKSCGCLRKIPNHYDDLTGKRFGRLEVLERIGTKNNSPYWKCKCDCGNYTNASSANLKSGNVISCGCHRIESAQTHGLSKTRIYRIYAGMKSRCYNENDTAYKNYGARGITICNEWIDDFVSFYNWAVKNGYSDELSIDRINVNGNYEPNNCRWITQKMQARNKRNNLMIEYRGKTKALVEWSEELGISYDILNDRITALGWDVEKAFEKPIKNMHRGN